MYFILTYEINHVIIPTNKYVFLRGYFEFKNKVTICIYERTRRYAPPVKLFYVISQNPDTKDYAIVFIMLRNGSFNNWIKKNARWKYDMNALNNIIKFT